MQLTLTEYNDTKILNEEQNKQLFPDVLFSYTKILSTTTADAAGECYTTTYNVYLYFLTKFAQFNGMTDIM